MNLNQCIFISIWSISFNLYLINFFWSTWKQFFSSLFDRRLEQIFSTHLYQKMSDIYRTKLTLPLSQTCRISFDQNLVSWIQLQLIPNFSPKTWKQSFRLNLINLISIASSYTKTDQSRCWAWHCSAPACWLLCCFWAVTIPRWYF